MKWGHVTFAADVGTRNLIAPLGICAAAPIYLRIEALGRQRQARSFATERSKGLTCPASAEKQSPLSMQTSPSMQQALVTLSS